MTRHALFAILLATLCVVGALPALAHGGQFRGPGDSVPPGLRDPFDPTPPPPIPPTGSPPTTTPGPFPGSTPSGPATPPNGSPTTPIPGAGTRERPASKSISFEDWTFWYHNNKADIENLKRCIYDDYFSESKIFQASSEEELGSTAATRLTQREVRRLVIPALLWAMDPRNAEHQDTESAAYIALAKVATDPSHIETIRRGLDADVKQKPVVQEAAALALGLLRRADPVDQFTARDLDKVRQLLFDVFGNDRHGTRTRGFAAVAIGLLGDQPTGSGAYAADAEAAARRTTQRLFGLLEDRHANPELQVALLMAIGLQSPASLTAEQRHGLAEAAYKGRLFKQDVSDLVQSYAAHALGRVGTTENDRQTLANILTARRGVARVVQRSAAIGLGLLGRQVAGEGRVEIAKTLLEGMARTKDNSTRNFAIISLAYLLIEDIRAETTDVSGNTRADETLLTIAADGRHLERPFGALALGLVLREIDDRLDLEEYQRFKLHATEVLRRGMQETSDPRVAAAYFVGAGIARDAGSRARMIACVADEGSDRTLRAYAALGLGLVGTPTPEILRVVGSALRERSSEELRRQCAVALGLLGDRPIPGTGKTAGRLLVDELREARSQSHKGQVVLALATIGTHDAIDDLVAILKDPQEQQLTRALACAGLGLIGDLEWIPSLARASKHVNYRASTDLVSELLSIL